jgi:FKBP-type peptidyl-prolyl cis-trans isomerase SlyD
LQVVYGSILCEHYTKEMKRDKIMTLMIGKNSVVSMHYTLKDDGGEVMDSSEGKEPLVYLHGANNLIPGLENELQGKTAGAKFEATISPEKAYGERNDDLIQVINKSMFEGVEAIEPGMTFVAQGEGGVQRQVRVTDVSGEDVTIDANHPMAGLTLHFTVEVVEVREGTDQEIEHGHVHQGGHNH